MTVQIYALREGLDSLLWPILKIFFQTVVPLMISFDYTQLPKAERRLLCHDRIMTLLQTHEWTAVEDLEEVWAKYHPPGRYKRETVRYLQESLWFMESKHIIHVRVTPNTDTITHVRKVRHVPGLTTWRPRRVLRAQARPPSGE